MALSDKRLVSVGVINRQRGVVFDVVASFLPGTGKPLITGNLCTTSKEALMVGLVWADHNLGAIIHWLDNVESGGHVDDGDRVFASDRDVSIHFSHVVTNLGKMGYSLGVTAATAVVACYLEEAYGLPLKQGCTAMTGEINLRGQLLAVSDIHIKVQTARRCGCERIIIPEANRPDVESMMVGVVDEGGKSWIEQHVLMARDMIDVLGYVIEGTV